MMTRFERGVQEEADAQEPNAWQNTEATYFFENLMSGAQFVGREEQSTSMFTEAARDLFGGREGVQEYPLARDLLLDKVRSGEVAKEDVAHLYTPPLDWMDEMPQMDARKAQEYMQVLYPDTQIDTLEGREERKNAVLSDLRKKHEDMGARATFMGKVGGFLGAGGMYATDPTNVAATVLGPWSQAAKASRFAQHAALAVEQVAVEAMTGGAVMAHKESMGEEYGSKDIMMNMGGAVLFGAAIKETLPLAQSIARSIGVLKKTAAGTVEGQKAIKSLEFVEGEVKTIEKAGAPLADALDEVDNTIKSFDTPAPARNIADPEEFPEMRNYENDADLQGDYDELVARRGEGPPTEGELPDAQVPVGVSEVANKIEIEYKSSKEIMGEFDAEIDRTLQMRNCLGI